MIYEKLKLYTNVDEAVKAAHVQNIENKYKKESNDSVVSDYSGEDLLCPWCGNKLVLRTAKKGQNAGKQFYECSAFPQCRYIKNESKA